MKVVDASVAVKWFLAEQGRDVAMTIIRSGETLAAPDIVMFEVSNVLRRKQRQGLIEARQVTAAVETMALCFSRLVPSIDLAEEAVKLSMALDHSVYDCAYLACAALLGASLVTADHVFAAKVVGTDAGHLIHVLESS